LSLIYGTDKALNYQHRPLVSNLLIYGIGAGGRIFCLTLSVKLDSLVKDNHYEVIPCMLTLGQAAKETGKSKTAITRLEGGQYRIDPAELFRVYQSIDRKPDGKGVHSETPQEAAGLQRETELLRELVTQIKEERDDLRRRLDNAEAARQREADAREQAAAELRRLTLMLTDQRPPPPTSEGTSSPVVDAGKGGLWEKLFGRATQ